MATALAQRKQHRAHHDRLMRNAKAHGVADSTLVRKAGVVGASWAKKQQCLATADGQARPCRGTSAGPVCARSDLKRFIAQQRELKLANDGLAGRVTAAKVPAQRHYQSALDAVSQTGSTSGQQQMCLPGEQAAPDMSAPRLHHVENARHTDALPGPPTSTQPSCAAPDTWRRLPAEGQLHQLGLGADYQASTERTANKAEASLPSARGQLQSQQASGGSKTDMRYNAVLMPDFSLGSIKHMPWPRDDEHDGKDDALQREQIPAIDSGHTTPDVQHSHAAGSRRTADVLHTHAVFYPPTQPEIAASGGAAPAQTQAADARLRLPCMLLTK